MFSNGQFIFALLFFFAFVVVVSLSYQKDKRLHRKYYKGNHRLLWGILLFITLLFLIKFVGVGS